MDLRLKRSLARALGLAAVVATTAILAQPAFGSEPAPLPGSTVPTPSKPGAFPATPEGFAVSAREAVRIANTSRNVVEQSVHHGLLRTAIEARDDAWQVGYKQGGGEDEREIVQVIVDAETGAIRESWTGHQVAWPMARGYEGQFGHKLNAPWIWIPLSLVFILGLFDWRRPLRVVHLDLLVLLAFAVSHVFFNRGEIGVSVPLVMPVLAYLLARMLWLGLRGGSGLRPSLPTVWLAVAAVFLICFRLTLNVADSGVIDVGYAGVVGADRITHGEQIYGEGQFPDDNPFGDTYGPANYYAYVPFEAALPWSGEWDELPAAHAAAIAFDLATVVGLFAFGTRIWPGARGRRLGTVLAFAWLAYPYTAFALQSNANDSLVAALVIWSLALFARPLARGALLALAVAVKFAPLALVGLFVSGERGLLTKPAEESPAHRLGRLRIPAFVALAFAATTALMLAHPAIDPGLATFWERTAESQLDRSSPFSIWGQVEGLGWLQATVLALAGALAVALAFLPRRRTIGQVAALAAAVLIALELAADHWFYLYIPWFAGPLLIALAIPGRARA